MRFAASFEKNASSSSGDARFTVSRYNLNATDVTIGTNSITLNRSGLYHFDLQVTANVSYGGAQTVFPFLNCWLYTGALNAFELVDGRSMAPSTTGNQFFTLDGKSSLEIYITAPATLRVYHGFGFISGSTGQVVSGYLAGHLISE